VAIQGPDILVKIAGAPVAFSSAATASTADTNYALTAGLAGQPWDAFAAVSVLVGGVATTDAYAVNRLLGQIEFSTAAVRVVTVSGSYLPMSQAASAKSYAYSGAANSIPDTVFNSSWITRSPGLKDLSGTLGQFWADRSFSTMLASTTYHPTIIEIYDDAGSTRGHRFWAQLGTVDVEAAVDGLVEETVGWECRPDADHRVAAFST